MRTMKGKRSSYRCKIALAGDGAVGKTSLIVRFVHKSFQREYKMTIGADLTVKDIEVNGQFLTTLVMWDSAGQERFSFIRPMFWKGALGAFIVFDITRRSTMLHVKEWMNEILTHAGNISVILIGNKVDLEGTREVSKEEGENLAKELGIPYIETSAKTGEKVNEAFEELALMVTNKMIAKFSEKEFDEWRRKEGIIDLDEIPTKLADADNLIKNNKLFEAAEIFRHIADSYRLEHKKGDQQKSDAMISNALKYYERSAELYLKVDKYTEAAWSFEHLRSLYEKIGNVKASLEFFLKSTENYEQAGNFSGAAWRYSALASKFESNFELHEAFNFYDKSWKLFIKSKEFSLILEPLQKLSLIYENKNEYDKIKEIWNESIDAATKAKESFWAGQILELYVKFYCPPKDKNIAYERILDLYTEAAKKFRIEKNLSLETRSFLLAAEAALQLKRIEEAKKLYEKVLIYYVENNIWHQAARIAAILGKYEDTIKYYSKEVKENKNNFYEPFLYISTGEYYVLSKQHSKAIESFKSALKSIQKFLKSQDEILSEWKQNEMSYLQTWTDARIVFQEGVKYSEIDNHTNAQKMYKSAASKFEKGITEKISEEKRILLKAFVNLCNSLHTFEEMQKLEQMGDLDKAKKLRRIFNFNLNYANANFIKAGQFSISKSINSILEAVEEKEFSKAKVHAGNIFPSLQPISTQKLSNLGLANTYLTCNIKDVKPLQINLNESCAVSIQIKIDEKFFNKTKEDWLPLLLTCSDTLFSPISMPLTLTDQLTQFDYVFTPKFIEAGKTTIKIQINDIDQTILLKSLVTDPVKVLRKYIPLVINFIIETDGDTLYFSCDINGPVTQKIKPIKLQLQTSELLQMADQVEKIAMDNSNPNKEFKKYGKELFNAIIPSEIDKELANSIKFAKSENVPIYFTINSSRELMSVPYELLYGKTTGIEDFISVKFPFYRYSAEKKITPIEKLTSRIAKVLLISANPLGGDYDLPMVDDENRNIQKLFEKIGIQSKLITSDNSTLQKVLEELLVNEYEAIHFSGHGFWAKNPMESGLVVGLKNKPEYLTADIIKKILQETKLKLIFLNSCYSAAQSKQVLPKQEILGIADALIQAGVPTIIGMQWQISDQGALLLSKNFYEQTFRKNMNFQTALKVSRLELKKQYPQDPSWACPMLVKHPSL
ncbi:MAG: CHAT domain-containing protein [Promethearchaeota archaeon]